MNIACCSFDQHEIITIDEQMSSFTMRVQNNHSWHGFLHITRTLASPTLDITLLAHAKTSASLSFFVKGSGTIRFHLIAAESSSSLSLEGAYMVEGNEVLVIETAQQHAVPHSQSQTRIYGVAYENARVSYKGLVTIGEAAAGTRAVQENKNIVLGATAQVTSIPAIEVLNNDVQCSHGSAISYLEEEHLLYLESRGLESAVMQELLIENFLCAAYQGWAREDYWRKMIQQALK